MTWSNDNDGWRDDSTEGPYDTLKTHYASQGDLEIFRSSANGPYKILFRSKIISQQDSIAMAKAWADQWWKEKINDTDVTD